MFKSVPMLIDVAKFKVAQRRQGIAVPEDPHFDEESTAFFREALVDARLYVEWGSGGSTLLADRLNVRTISVESDRYFGGAVRRRLKPQGSVTLLCPSIGLTGPWGRPVYVQPTPSRVARWRRYLEVAEKAAGPGAAPDFVLVDGRFRRACALFAARWAQQGGTPLQIFFDDYYSEGRDHYAAVERQLGSPRRIGRAALFRIDEGRPVTAAEVDEALPDYR